MPTALTDYVNVVSLTDLLGFDQVRFDKAIGTSVKKKARSTRWPVIRLSDAAKISRGASPRPIDRFITKALDGVLAAHSAGDGEIGQSSPKV